MTTAKPPCAQPADQTTPSDAATAARLSGITYPLPFDPFGEPGGYESLGIRLNMMSPPRWGPPGRGEPQPDEMTGVRPCHFGTGHTQRPVSGGIVGDGGCDDAAVVASAVAAVVAADGSGGGVVHGSLRGGDASARFFER